MLRVIVRYLQKDWRRLLFTLHMAWRAYRDYDSNVLDSETNTVAYLIQRIAVYKQDNFRLTSERRKTMQGANRLQGKVEKALKESIR